MQTMLPAGWERIEPAAPYVKLVKRAAVTVPKRYRGEAFERDIVVLLTDDTVGVAKGPGARQTWSVDDPEAAGRELVDVLEAWIDEGGDPYGGADLDERLAAVVGGGA